MRAADVEACIDIVASHPTIGPRYGRTISSLGATWSRLIGTEAFSGRVFEEANQSAPRIVAVGTRFFVTDSFLTEMKTPPYRWTAPEIVKRVSGTSSPLLSDKEVRAANLGSGLNLLVLEGAVCARDMGRPEVIGAFFEEFIALHRGFRLKELITQGTSTDVMNAQLHSGGYLLDDTGQYSRAPHPALDRLLHEPHFIGVSRELALKQFGSWVSNLFIHNAPRFKFRPSEQRLLLTALDGGTDEEISRELGVSISAVKKSWLQIYERVAELEPYLAPDVDPESDDGSHERGKTKKQRLLSYLREHMEELRPAIRESR